MIRYSVLVLSMVITLCSTSGNMAAAAEQAQIRGPRIQPETAGGMYAPGQHELYDGRFKINGTRIYQAGTLKDESRRKQEQQQNVFG